MAITYQGTFGGGEKAGSFDDTLSWTTTRAIAAGEHAVVIVASSIAVASITVGALSLSSDFVGGAINFWSAHAASGIASGSTVTVTLSGPHDDKAAVGEGFSGIATSSYLGATASDGAYGSTVASGTTDATPASGDLGLAAAHVTGDSTTSISSVDSGYTLGGNDGTNPWGLGDAIGAMQAAYKVLASSGATSANFTLTTGVDHEGAIAIYKAAAGGTPPTLRIVQSNQRW